MANADPQRSVRVLVAEASDIARQAIQVELGGLAGVEIVGWAAKGTAVVEQVQTLRPDLVVLSLELGEMDGVEVYTALRVACPEVTVVIFDTMFRTGHVAGETEAEVDNQRLFAASYVVATQLVPKVRSVFRSAVGVERLSGNE